MLLGVLMTVISCGEIPKKQLDSKVDKTLKVDSSPSKAKSQDKHSEKLKNGRPISNSALESWFPKTLGGLDLERTRPIPLLKGQTQVAGFYKRKGDKLITLTVSDAAGPEGSVFADKIGIYGNEPDSNEGNIQLRSVNVKGRLARQDYNTETNATTISFFHDSRFLIKIAALGHSTDEAWALADELNFEALDKVVE